MKLCGFYLLYTPNINVVLQTSNALIYLLHFQTDSKGDVGGQKVCVRQAMVENTFTQTALHISLYKNVVCAKKLCISS
jgi:hypothetical protein